MKILIIPDKFKGSLTSQEVCNAIEEGIVKALPNAKITKIPVADGGEGSLEILETTLGFKRIYLDVENPVFKKVKAFYGLSKQTAYIEMAKASGLQLLNENERNPLLTTSYGTGEMIADAIKRGAKKIFLFIGGSATNDAGIGIATALGYKFKDEQNNILKPVGKNLSRIKYIDSSKVLPLNDVEIIVLTDVENPLYGRNGAAYVYAKQKGATEEDIKLLDKGLRNFDEILTKIFKKDISKIHGSGAAGGVGYGMMVFCNAKIRSGINAIMDLLTVDKFIKQSNLVITGEGFLDKQTLEGKVVKGIAEKCKKYNKALTIVCGDTSLTESEIESLNAVIVKSIKTKNISKEKSIKNAYNLLVERAEELISKIQY